MNNCPYCDNEMSGALIKICTFCDLTMRVRHSGVKDTMFDCVGTKYVILVEYDLNITTLYHITDQAPLDKIIALNYIIDINPSNVKRWLERLLNLRAFS
jgi:hypothetical protein